VPLNRIAVGDPAVLPPEDHEKIWAIQKPLDFPRNVFGPGEMVMPMIMPRPRRRRHEGSRRAAFLTDRVDIL
jgi:hypothetical protein